MGNRTAALRSMVKFKLTYVALRSGLMNGVCPRLTPWKLSIIDVNWIKKLVFKFIIERITWHRKNLGRKRKNQTAFILPIIRRF